jgi:hypothetical protein
MGLFHDAFARRRIAKSLMNYAHARDWKSADYQVYMRGEDDWDFIHVVLVASEFEGKPNYESYSTVWQHLRDDLADRPDLLSSIGLVVKDPRQAEDRGIFGIGPEYTLEVIPSRN